MVRGSKVFLDLPAWRGSAKPDLSRDVPAGNRGLARRAWPDLPDQDKRPPSRRSAQAWPADLHFRAPELRTSDLGRCRSPGPDPRLFALGNSSRRRLAIALRADR